MSFVEELISKAFLSKNTTTLASKGILLEGEESPIIPSPAPPVVDDIYAAGGNNLGFMLYGRSTPTIKVAATINGIEHRVIAVKNAGLGVNTQNVHVTPTKAPISVTVSNVNV